MGMQNGRGNRKIDVPGVSMCPPPCAGKT